MGIREEMLAKLQAGQASDQARTDAFRRKVLGDSPTVMSSPVVQAGLDRGEHLLNTLNNNPYSSALGGPVAAAASFATSKGLGALGLGAAPGRKDGIDPDDLSKKAQQQMRVDDVNASSFGPMNTPLASVQAAKTLDPDYEKKAQQGGGGGGGPSPGLGLKAEYDAMRRAGIKTLEEERELTGELGVDKAGRVMGVASLQEAEAARQQALAEKQQEVDAAASAKHEAFIARNEQLADEIGKMKTDPGKLLRNADNQTQFSIGLGATMGGILSGMNGGPNTSLDRLDKIIDRDIRSQESEIDNKKASLTARNSVFGQMLQETGDRRLAAQQTRVMMLEAAKVKIQADSDRLGIPEVRTNAELAVNGIQQKIDNTKTAMAKEAYETFQRQAAAAAAARAAAEEKAWQRAMEVRKMGLEQDKLTIEASKATGTSQKDLDEKVQKLGTALADPKLQEGRAVTDALMAVLEKTKKGDQLNGLGLGSRMVGGLPGGELLLSDEANVNRQNWGDFLGVLRKMRTGAGGSAPEMERILQESQGASTAAEKANAIRKAHAFFAKQEDSHRAAAGPEASAKFDANKSAVGAQMPGSVQVKK